MATKTIGATGDYTTLASYATYLDTLNALAAPEIGKVQSGGVTLSSGTLTFTGFTPSAANPWTLQADDGASFRDHPNKATNPLRFDTSYGAYIDCNTSYARAIQISVPYATIKDLQLRQTNIHGQGLFSAGFTGNFTMDHLIIEGQGNSNFSLAGWSGSGASNKARNCIIICKTSNYAYPMVVGEGGLVANCTFVRPSNISIGTPANDRAIQAFYTQTITVQNCVSYNFTEFMKHAFGSFTYTGSGNVTDAAAFPTGLSGQTGLVATTEFEEPSNASSAMDWRLKSTSVKCKNGGVDVASVTDDIIGTARTSGSYDAGCWEFVAAATQIDKTAADTLLPKLAEGTVLIKALFFKADTASVVTTEAVTDFLSVLTRIDTLAIGWSEAAVLFSTLSTADTVSLTLNDIASVLAIMSALDSVKPKLTAATTLTVAINTIDNTALTLDEAATLLASLSRSDDMLVLLSDVSTVQDIATIITKSGVDSLALTLTETAALFYLLAATDSVSPSISEAVQILSFLQRTDTSAVSLGETAVLLAALSRTDSLATTLTETSNVLTALARTDSLALTFSEVVSLLSFLQRSDTVSLSVSDAATLLVALTSNDALTPKTTEAELTTAVITGLESIGISLTEASTLAITIVNVIMRRKSFRGDGNTDLSMRGSQTNADMTGQGVNNPQIRGGIDDA